MHTITLQGTVFQVLSLLTVCKGIFDSKIKAKTLMYKLLFLYNLYAAQNFTVFINRDDNTSSMQAKAGLYLFLT